MRATEAREIIASREKSRNSYKWIKDVCVGHLNRAVRDYGETTINIQIGSGEYIYRLKKYFEGIGYTVDIDLQESTTGYHLIINL